MDLAYYSFSYQGLREIKHKLEKVFKEPPVEFEKHE